MAKDAHSLSQQFERSFKAYFSKNKCEGYTDEESTQLALTELCVGIARSMKESENFYISRMAFRDREIAELKERNKRQIDMITRLEDDVQMWKDRCKK